MAPTAPTRAPTTAPTVSPTPVSSGLVERLRRRPAEFCSSSPVVAYYGSWSLSRAVLDACRPHPRT
eukprot:19272-Eustigmatos_ZCMA.PRE.1